MPPVVSNDIFEAAANVSRDNSKWSPRNTDDDAWLLRALVRCGPCGVGVSCHKMRGRDGTFHRYYYCHNHDPLRAGGEARRCRERNIRADALDAFVFEQVREALLRPDVLLAGEQALSALAPVPDDELLAAQLARLQRRCDSAEAERRRLVDLYQAGLVDIVELKRRAKELDARRCQAEAEHSALAEQHKALAKDHRLRHRVASFSTTVTNALDGLNFADCQKLLRLVVDEVTVTGWDVQIKLRIPLDDPPEPSAGGTEQLPKADAPRGASSNDRLRSLGGHWRRVVPDRAKPGERRIAPAQLGSDTRRGGDFYLATSGEFKLAVDNRASWASSDSRQLLTIM